MIENSNLPSECSLAIVYLVCAFVGAGWL